MPSSPPSAPYFSAATDAWIDVRSGTRYSGIGLYDLLLKSHTLDDLALTCAPAASALLRIAVAVTARVTGLDNPDLSAAQWNKLRRDMFAAGRLDADAVDSYFARYCWDVFDPDRPWLQDPALPGQREPTGVNDLTHRPTGNNLVWFTAPGPTPGAVPTPHALQHLLVWHYYGRHGTSGWRTIGTHTSRTLSGGPLRTSVSFHPQAGNLFESLLAGCPPFTGEEQLTDDACPWEEPPPDPLAPLPPVTWPGRLLTGRSRHALRLVPDDTGAHVTDAYISWAAPSTTKALAATDPYLVHTLQPGAKDKSGAPVRSARRADADRAWWRELDALLLAPDENAKSGLRRPDIFSTLNDLPANVRRTLRVRVHGFHQEPKDCINRQWYTALTPPLMNLLEEEDPAGAQRVADCCQSAERAARHLAEQARQAWKETRNITTSRGLSAGAAWATTALSAYWPLAERAFWKLLDERDDPIDAAFTGAAVTALREATRSARARSPHAARAVTRAVRSLSLTAGRKQPS